MFNSSEQRRAGIPRAVAAVEQPAIVRRVRQQDPGREGEAAGEMCHAGVDRDHEIKTVSVGAQLELSLMINE